MSTYQNQTLTCVDCRQDFIWTTGEQEFFAEKGFTDPPKRCKDCRRAKRERQGEGGRQGGGRK